MQSSRIKKLGKILHYSDLGNAIVKTKHKLPKIGSSVVDENLKHVGSVIDIFGPVKAPFVSIKLKKHFKNQITSEVELYTINKRETDVKKRYRKKK